MLLFGSTHKLLFDKCAEYNAKTQAKAVKWLEKECHADLGGTEILPAMRAIYDW